MITLNGVEVIKSSKSNCPFRRVINPKNFISICKKYEMEIYDEEIMCADCQYIQSSYLEKEKNV